MKSGPGEQSPGAKARQDGLIAALVGHKVSVSTRDFHHVVGYLVSFEPDGSLYLRVAGRHVTLPRAAVARIHAADPALAEYLK